MPKAKRPRQGKDTASQLYWDLGGPDRYKLANSDRLEKTSDLSAQPLQRKIRSIEIANQQRDLN